MLIRIKNLRLRTVVGVHDWEKDVLQDVVIGIDVELRNERAIRTDRMEDTVDYRALTKRIVERVEKSRFTLIGSGI